MGPQMIGTRSTKKWRAGLPEGSVVSTSTVTVPTNCDCRSTIPNERVTRQRDETGEKEKEAGDSPGSRKSTLVSVLDKDLPDELEEFRGARRKPQNSNESSEFNATVGGRIFQIEFFFLSPDLDVPHLKNDCSGRQEEENHYGEGNEEKVQTSRANARDQKVNKEIKTSENYEFLFCFASTNNRRESRR
ncbi:hypothetical protein RUM44_004578 [Polyplax serrata]|uniref:Uncharacterized protein n=1 Tax=Polyplax serrata TaxID=468196 RepID=A0ABR1B386_POLSC